MGHVTKLFLESECQHKGNKRKNANSQQNLTVFSAATKLFKYYIEKDKYNFWTESSSLAQESTFKLLSY